jgi:hypothetical protein
MAVERPARALEPPLPTAVFTGALCRAIQGTLWLIVAGRSDARQLLHLVPLSVVLTLTRHYCDSVRPDTVNASVRADNGAIWGQLVSSASLAGVSCKNSWPAKMGIPV